MTDFGVNQGLVEELFLQYCANPHGVSESWRRYFDALPPEAQPTLTSNGALSAPARVNGAATDAEHESNGGNLRPSALLPPTAEHIPYVGDKPRTSFVPSSDVLAANELQGRVSALVNTYRVRGHLFARLDPLGQQELPPNELLLERYGLDHVDPETVFATGDLAGPPTLTLHEIVERLQETYCRTIGVEYTVIEAMAPRRWLQERMESTCNRIDLTEDDQIRILTKLTDAEIFEQFLHKNYVGAKRFSLEGAESFIPLMDLLIERSAALGVSEVVVGMAHRGRLNVLANLMEKRLHEIFAGFEDDQPEAMLGAGDVKYHLGYSTDRKTRAGHDVHLTLCFNPSHLEFVAPVVEGRVRAKQARIGDDRDRVLPLIVHGDAALAGQGIVAETLNLGGLDGYETGGTIHVVINNQVGFTTLPGDSRTTRYCTDLTRMLRCPVFHVNGEDPEAVAQAAYLATEYRQRFQQDVVIDLYCYRKYGHNEGDEPRFTQPLMYAAIDKKRTIREVYVDTLIARGQVTRERATGIIEKRVVELEAALQETRSNGSYGTGVSSMQGLWTRYHGGRDVDAPDIETAVPRDRLEELVRLANRIPEGFDAHKKIARLFEQRIEYALADKPFDWGTAETLAYASLLAEGTRIRITGQDSRRGTFSHRHAVIYDQTNGQDFCPLAHVKQQGPKEQGAMDEGVFEIYDSPLSEAGVLGFDYGFSLDSPDALVIWEAQFGDFVNSAQVIIDQFLVSSEDKWNRLSGLVMLLPHGFEGQGPEHSSARLERFLTMCAEDNMQVCNLTNAAQIFHVLRRQVVRSWRKPLVIMSPKSLLRAPAARATLRDLAEGTFQRIIADDKVPASKAKRLLLCSGKIYHDLAHAREKRNADDVAIVRFEQLYPIRKQELMDLLAGYSDDTDVVWIQEEPWNMGAWFFMNARFGKLSGHRFRLRCVSRAASASPATGSKAAHEIEQRRLIDVAFADADD